MVTRHTLEIGTDGGCRGNPGIGSWAFVVSINGSTNIKGKSGFKEVTTNNEMELQAFLEAVRWLKTLRESYEIKVYTDSSYLVNGFTKWMHGWKNNMWRTASNSPVKNKQLWHDIYHESKGLDIELTKVKGHSGFWLNEAADERCNVEMDNYELGRL